jgi:hypothetical protein
MTSGARSDFLEHSKNSHGIVRTPAKTTTPPQISLEETAIMKLNVKNIRYLSPDDWRVLTAVCARPHLSIA